MRRLVGSSAAVIALGAALGAGFVSTGASADDAPSMLPDTVGGTAQTRAGVGSIIKLSSDDNLLLSGGPTWADRRTGYHFYAALGLNF